MSNSIHTVTLGDEGIYLITDNVKYWACMSRSVEMLVDELGFTKDVKLDLDLAHPLAQPIYNYI